MLSMNQKLEEYSTKYSSALDPIFYELERETYLKTLSPQMLSGPLQGQFLRLLSLMVRPKRILEIGTFTGYSCLAFLDGLQEGGTLITLEANEEIAHWAKRYIDQSPRKDEVQLIVGDAQAVIPSLEGPFDLIFVDAGKLEYPWYYEQCIPLLRSGGILIADNVLWSGKVLEETKDAETQALQAFNQKVLADERVENVIIPMRDGINVVRKK